MTPLLTFHLRKTRDSACRYTSLRLLNSNSISTNRSLSVDLEFEYSGTENIRRRLTIPIRFGIYPLFELHRIMQLPYLQNLVAFDISSLVSFPGYLTSDSLSNSDGIIIPEQSNRYFASYEQGRLQSVIEQHWKTVDNREGNSLFENRKFLLESRKILGFELKQEYLEVSEFHASMSASFKECIELFFKILLLSHDDNGTISKFSLLQPWSDPIEVKPGAFVEKSFKFPIEHWDEFVGVFLERNGKLIAFSNPIYLKIN
jgi:hypothetical protein